MKKTPSPSSTPHAPRPYSPAETRSRILDAAENLFASNGLDAVSIRDITGVAGVNLGAVNYHFGSRRDLVAAVFDRRMAPLTAERLAALGALEQAAGKKAAALEDVLEAFFLPAIRMSLGPERDGAVFGRLMARCMLEPNPMLETLLRGHVEPVIRRFDAALIRTLPRLRPADVFWRMHLLIGGLHHSLLMHGRKLPAGKFPRMDVDTYTKRFVVFAAAAFRATGPGEDMS